jgi:hypothetical protein
MSRAVPLEPETTAFRSRNDCRHWAQAASSCARRARIRRHRSAHGRNTCSPDLAKGTTRRNAPRHGRAALDALDRDGRKSWCSRYRAPARRQSSLVPRSRLGEGCLHTRVEARRATARRKRKEMTRQAARQAPPRSRAARESPREASTCGDRRWSSAGAARQKFRRYESEGGTSKAAGAALGVNLIEDRPRRSRPRSGPEVDQTSGGRY